MYIIRQMVDDSIIHQRIAFVGTEKQVIDFVNSQTSDAYDFMETWEQTEYWLKHNGYIICEEKDKKKAKTLEFAYRLWDFQNDISYCNQETGIVRIDTYEEAVKFLDWVLKEENFEYEFQK